MFKWFGKLIIWLFGYKRITTKNLPEVKVSDKIHTSLDGYVSPPTEYGEYISPTLLALVKVRDEANSSINNLSQFCQECLNVLLHQAVPQEYRKSLLSKKDMFLISKNDVYNLVNHRTISDTDWAIIASHALYSLHKDGMLKSDLYEGSSNVYLRLYADDISQAIKDIKAEPEKTPQMNSIGPYR